VQILEGDAQILQRNTVIDFLQEQVHDLNQELGGALGHIEMIQEQQMPPLGPNKLEEEDSEEEPEEIEGVSEIDSEHGDPEPHPQFNHSSSDSHSSSGSQSSVGNLDDF
jgi:hypothetical protein